MSEQYEWPVLPLSAEILHLDDDMLKAVLVEIRANVRAAVQAAQPEAVGTIYERCAQIAFDADHMGSVNLKLLKNRIGNSIRAAAPTTEATSSSDAEDAAMWRAHVDKLEAVVTYCPTCCQGFTAKKEMTRDEIIFECGKTSGRAAIATKGGTP